jgi:hypothetical protein
VAGCGGALRLRADHVPGDLILVRAAMAAKPRAAAVAVA